MAKSDVPSGLAALAFGLGIATGAAMMAGTAQKRAVSNERIRVGLQALGLTLTSAELGRTQIGPVWVLTIILPDQRVMTASVQLQAAQDPHTPEAAAEVIQRVSAGLPGALAV